MPDSPSLDPVQLGAYFDLIEVTSLLRHAVEQQLREAGDLSYVQFQLLARLGDSPTGSHRMTDLADGVVYSRSGLTYQAGLLEKAGLVERTPSPEDERSITVTITDAGRALLAKVLPGHIEVVSGLLRQLPYIEATPEGLHPHDAVRATLAGDLRWRDPERYDDIRARISLAGLQAVRSAAEEDALLRAAEWMFLFRHQSDPDELYNWRAHPHIEDTPLRPEDVPDVLRMAEEAEGPRHRRPRSRTGCAVSRTPSASTATRAPPHPCRSWPSCAWTHHCPRTGPRTR